VDNQSRAGDCGTIRTICAIRHTSKGARKLTVSRVKKEICQSGTMSRADDFSSLSQRISRLERQMSPFANSARRLEERIDSQERELEHLRFDVENLKSHGGTSIQPEIESHQQQLEDLRSEVLGLRFARACAAPITITFPMSEEKSLDGIICYLTEKQAGNVHQTGIVTMTSSSVLSNDARFRLENAADLTTQLGFRSKNAPGQWICWDFHQRRVRLTHYTIDAWRLKSWVLEASLDGENWIAIDGQIDNRDFQQAKIMASFAVSNRVECRFVRLTQTDKNHRGNDCLRLRLAEFFGRLTE
jgi:hypothetical protein